MVSGRSGGVVRQNRAEDNAKLVEETGPPDTSRAKGVIAGVIKGQDGAQFRVQSGEGFRAEQAQWVMLLGD